ncbi:MAG: hypothetical protein ACLUPV_11315, partial [Bilophila wadsworthia]
HNGDLFPVMLREFARSHGLDIPRLSTTQHSALSGANRETFNAVLDELIPEQGHVVEANTDAFRAVFDSINEDGALAGLRPDAINPRPFYQGVSQALTPLLNAARGRNAVDAAQLRQLAGDASSRTLGQGRWTTSARCPPTAQRCGRMS